MKTSSPLLAIAALTLAAQTPEQPARHVTDPGVVTTRQAITPAGVPSIFQGRVFGAAWSPSGEDLWILHATDLYRLDWRNNKVKFRAPHGGTPGVQSITTNPVTGDVLLGNSQKARTDKGPVKATLLTAGEGGIRTVAGGLGSWQPGSISVAAKDNASGQRLAVVPLVWENQLAVIDVKTGTVLNRIACHTAPFHAAISADGTVAWVSNLGGRPPKPGEAFASPMQKPAERIPVDKRGVASTGDVVRIDLVSGKLTHTIATGLHPTALAWDEGRHRLYVANGNNESVSVVDTNTFARVRTIDLQPFSDKVRGIAPVALSLDSKAETLYVACGGINAVAVLQTSTSKLLGMIPTAWYPNSVAVSPDGKHLAVTSLLGPGSAWRDAPAKRFVHSYRGSVAVLPIPTSEQLASYTTAVAENNHLRLANATPKQAVTEPRARKPLPVPVRSGDPSPVEHVVYIIKENRTYDQVLGDVSRGNGDPSLVMFGEQVTPNQHRLAEEFVLLDNFYATGGNSADGHQWLTQANETEYCLWPGYQGRSYPFDGSDPMVYSSGGFIWDYAMARGKTVRIYGEYAGRMAEPVNRQRSDLLKRWSNGDDFSNEWKIRAPIEPINKILASNYPSYTNAIPDVVRAQIFLRDLKKYEAEGKLPNLLLIQLPSDHTFGTVPNVSTPRAMVADNDLAVGKIVAALTKTPFWKKMAIFIVEDDAQNGVDHVDGHRTTAFVVSPWTRRRHIDSTFYSHQSMLKTMELMLGLPTMSLFDLIANDMRNSFTDTPDFTPYTEIANKYDLMEMNPPLAALSGPARTGAIASSRMNWSVPDAVPTEKLNRILWGSIRGWRTPYPQPKTALFAPLSLDIDDDERDEH